MKTTYTYQVFAWGKGSTEMHLFGSYKSRSLAFSHARELYYHDLSVPVFVVALPTISVREDYSLFCWTCVGVPTSLTNVVIERVSIVKFFEYLNI